MADPASLIGQVEECVVQVMPFGGVSGGSGFFIAPGMVLTCAHVVSGGRRAPHVIANVTIRWRHADYAGVVVRAAPWVHEEGGLWGFPDLAVVQLSAPPDDHPCVSLTSRAPDPAARLFVTGYRDVYDAEAGLGGASVAYVSRQEVRGRWFFSVKDDELAPGMSGGPVLDLDRGKVCAVAKTTRRKNDALGGLVIPVHAISRLFRGDRSWLSLPPRVRSVFPLAELLTPDEEDDLRDICRVMTPPADLSGMYRRVVGQLAPDPATPLGDVQDLVWAVADTLSRSDGVRSLLVLFRLLAVAAGKTEAEALRALADGVAGRLGLDDVRDDQRNDDPDEPRRPSLEIRLTPSGADRRLYTVAVWLYRDAGQPPIATYCDDNPVTLKQIRTSLRKLIGDQLDEMPDDPENILLAFSLPPNLLTEPVDQWHLNQSFAPLGSQYPVVVRSLRRPSGTGPHWRQRWKRLQEHTPGQDAEVCWIGCGDETVGSRELHAWFQAAQSRTVLAVPFRPTTKPARSALEAAFEAGVPAVIWRQKACTDHSAPEETTHCAGSAFRDDLTRRLDGISLSRLPDVARILRNEASEPAAAPGHCGRDLAILWDDPSRLPSAVPARFRAPRAPQEQDEE